jgi:hypothetical protein
MYRSPLRSRQENEEEMKARSAAEQQIHLQQETDGWNEPDSRIKESDSLYLRDSPCIKRYHIQNSFQA